MDKERKKQKRRKDQIAYPHCKIQQSSYFGNRSLRKFHRKKQWRATTFLIFILIDQIRIEAEDEGSVVRWSILSLLVDFGVSFVVVIVLISDHHLIFDELIIILFFPSIFCVPSILSIVPQGGPANTNITIQGFNFENTRFLACSFR